MSKNLAVPAVLVPGPGILVALVLYPDPNVRKHNANDFGSGYETRKGIGTNENWLEVSP